MDAKDLVNELTGIIKAIREENATLMDTYEGHTAKFIKNEGRIRAYLHVINILNGYVRKEEI